MKPFLYELDDLSFDLPWTAPDVYRLRLWFNDLVRKFPDSRNFDFQLLGDFWSSGQGDAWSIVLFVSALDLPEPGNDLPVKMATRIRELFRNAVSLGLEKHRLLFELSFTAPDSAKRLFQIIQQVESGGEVPLDIGDAIGSRFEAFRRVTKTVNGLVEFEKEPEFNNHVPCDQGALYERSGFYERTLLKKAAQGRVYFLPVSLNELFTANGSSPQNGAKS